MDLPKDQLSVYAADIQRTAERVRTMSGLIVDSLSDGHYSLSLHWMKEMRLHLDAIASNARKMSDEYPVDFSKELFDIVANYQPLDTDEHRL